MISVLYIATYKNHLVKTCIWLLNAQVAEKICNDSANNVTHSVFEITDIP